MLDRRMSLVPPDGGWGWVVMVASFFNAGAMYGCIKTGGILYVAIMNQLQLSRTAAAFIPSLAFSISCLIGPLASSLSTRYSYRTVVFFGAVCASSGMALTAVFLHSYAMIIVCYGFIMGIGCGMVGTPNMIVVYTYFSRHRALASGFSLAGSSVGGFLIPPFIEWVIKNHGLFAALLAMSAIVLHICPMSLLFRPITPTITRNRLSAIDLNGSAAADLLSKNRDSSNGQTSSSSAKAYTTSEDEGDRGCVKKFFRALNLDVSIFREKYYYMVAFGFTFQTYTWSGYLTLLPDYALHEASEVIDPSMAAMLVSYMSAGDVVFRIISGWLMDKSKSKRPYAYILLLFASSAVFFGYVFSQPYYGLVISSVAVGVLMSGVIVLQPVLLHDYIGPKRFSMALGISVGINGIIILFAAPSLAAIRELAGSYKASFFLMGLGLFIPACAWLIDVIVVRCRHSGPVKPETQCKDTNEVHV